VGEGWGALLGPDAHGEPPGEGATPVQSYENWKLCFASGVALKLKLVSSMYILIREIAY
jgi:hypothetical protein